MHKAAQAYGSVAKQIVSPRELEADLLLKAAARLQAVKDNWNANQASLDDALLYNRKVWTIVMTSATGPDSELPREIRPNFCNLGVFVLNHTLTVSGDPQPERLTSLININRELAAGLLGR